MTDPPPSQPSRTRSDDPDTRDEDAYDDYLAALERGEDPDLAAFLGARGGGSTVLRERLARLRRMMGPDALAAPPERVGRFEVRGVVGVGGMGEVLRAYDARLQREVAVKVLPPSFALDAERLARFRREARLLAALDHPNVATVYELGEEPDGSLHLVMELVPGADLRQTLRDGVPPFDVTLVLVTQVASGLAAAHAAGVLHRDLKPANVVVTPDGRAKVLDFGIAKRVDDELDEVTAAGGVVGTPGYMSPEQSLGLATDARSDVYAFGCLLYECLTGVRASASRTPALLLKTEEPPALELPSDLAPELSEVLEACLERDPEARPADMGIVEVALRRIRRAEFAPRLKSRALPPPSPLTTLFGRDALLAEFDAMLDERRLMTLVGPGGAGKSRVALELARRRAARHHDGAAYVELAAVEDESDLVLAVLHALGQRLAGGDEPQDALFAAVASFDGLIVFDNCEHMLDAAARLASKLVQRAPRLVVMTTSREPLGVTGEQVMSVPPLSVPPPCVPGDGAETATLLASLPSVAMFVDRARLVDRDFVLDERTAPRVAEICRRLDGLPLALELAASRIASIGVDELASELEGRFDVLVAKGRGALPHHRTLAETVAWSHQLLSDGERTLFRRLGVFASSWTAATAAEVCAGDGLTAREVATLVPRLVEKSLVQRDGGRQRLLETLRVYARERLAEADETGALVERHARHYFARASEIRAIQDGPRRSEEFGLFEVDADDVAAAFERAEISETVRELGLRAACDLNEFWLSRGFLFEAERRMRQAVERLGEHTDRDLALDVLLAFGTVVHRRGAYAEALRIFGRALDLAKSCGDARRTSIAYRGLGYVLLHDEKYDEAEPLLVAALEVVRTAGDEARTSILLNDLGILQIYSGNAAAAVERYEESLAIRRRLGDRWGIASSLGNLGEAATRLGDFGKAQARLDESLAAFRALGDKRSVAESLEMSAALETRLERFGRAAVMTGAADRMREDYGFPKPVAERAAYDHDLQQLRAALGDEVFEAARAQGGKLSMDEAVAFTLRRDDDQPPPDDVPRAKSS